MKKPLVLAIIDGLGITEQNDGNAVFKANKENLLKIWNNNPNTMLEAAGEAVGLPVGQMGNSEVGHLNIGAGRTIYQSLVLINKAIEEKTFFQNEEYLNAINHVKENNSTLHIMGLLSDGGVHSHINHIFAMLEMAKKENVENVMIHAFLDGRDVDPKSSKTYLLQLEEKIKELNCGMIATVSGRYYSLDRDKRWDRVEEAYNTIIEGKTNQEIDDFISYVDDSYKEDILDEFIKPAKNIEYTGAKDNDSFIFMNFRPDRAIQLSAVITNENYNPNPEDKIFVPSFRPKNIKFVQTMKYSDDVIGTIAFKPEAIINTLGEVLSANNLKQLRIAETEKYPHVTFFFDGGVDKEIKGSKRILVNSPKVATYDLQPEMSAEEVTTKLINELDNDTPDVVILNFANPDMVGHTGKVIPTIKAIETVDKCMGEIYNKIVELNGTLLITADHGNSEKVLNEDGTPNTAHTSNLVPFVIANSEYKLKDGHGKLADIAPTILKILGIEKPKEMTGEDLIDG